MSLDQQKLMYLYGLLKVSKLLSEHDAFPRLRGQVMDEIKALDVADSLRTEVKDGS